MGMIDVQERFFPEAVTREKQLPPAPVNNSEGEHSFEPRRHVRSPPVVGVEDHLGIRLGSKMVTERAKFVPELDIVVDLAVERNNQSSVVGSHRLPATIQIDD